MAQPALPGLHHVTAIAGDAQQNVDFYVGVLGLRLVKKTVNFDDPGTYHLYYGDALGRPGTILTFFPWPGANRGRHGLGQAVITTLAVPTGAGEFWQKRLAENGVAAEERTNPFGETVLAFTDHDGMGLEIIERPDATEAGTEPWAGATVPAQYAIRTVDGVTLRVARRESTEAALTQLLGFSLVREAEGRIRYAAGGQERPAARLDVEVDPKSQRGLMGAGAVHHIAWRTPDDAAQEQWQSLLQGQGYNVSPVMDRTYFHSIYFREPGGVLFEIATDAPGFTADESPEELGTTLRLPPFAEENRAILERALPPLRVPVAAATAG